MPQSFRLMVSALALSAAALLSACGGGGDDSGTTTPPPPPPPPAATGPSITTQPASQTVNVGQPATFTVVATSAQPITYQWRRGGTDIAGATSASYTTPATTSADNGAVFSVAVSNAAGTTTSSNATLTVSVPAAAITTQPANQAVLVGGTVTFTVATSATSPTYQWQKKAPGAADFADIAGATAATLTFPGALVDDGAQYRARVNTTPAGTPAVSNAASLSVLEPSVTALAGTVHGPNNVDGAAGTALFSFPVGASIDNAGTVYLADFANHTIRKIATDGSVTTLAGTPGIQGLQNGPGATAVFNSPHDTAVQPDGSVVYVADYANQRIRAVAADGTVTTLAGSGAQGGADGPVATASFDLPRGLALSGPNILYVAELNGRRIREINLQTGTVDTVAGTGVAGNADGAALAATFASPADIAVDPGADLTVATDDTIYIADANNNAVRMLSRTSGQVTTLVGQFGSADGAAATAGFTLPMGVALINNTDLFVTDSGNHTIRRINLGVANTDPTYVVTVAGTVGAAGMADGVGAAGRFFLPYGIVSNGLDRLVVVNFGNNVVSNIAVTPGPVYTTTTLSGGASTRGYADGTGPAAKFNYPRGVARASNGDVYVADSVNQVVRKVSPAGEVTTVAGTFGRPGVTDGTPGNPLTAQLNYPSGVAVDGAGVVYIADAGSSRIRKVANGTVTTIANGGPIAMPRALVVNAAGTALYVASVGNSTIVRIDLSNNAATVVAGTGARGPAVGNRLTGQFDGAAGLVLDEANNRLYAADTGNHDIRVVNLASAAPDTDPAYLTVLAGNLAIPGTQDGVGTTARFITPVGLALEGTTTLYVADYGGHTIRRVDTATGAVTTVVGSPTNVGVTVGPITPSDRRSLNGPTAVAVEAAGPPATRLVVVDGTEHAVLKVTVAP